MQVPTTARSRFNSTAMAERQTVTRERIQNGPTRFVMLSAFFLIAAICLMASKTLAQPPHGKGAAPAKESIGERAAPDRVIVKFKSGARASAADMALSRAGVRVKKRMRFSGVSVLEIVEKGKPVEEVIRSLKESGLVEYAEPDFIVHIDSTFPAPPGDPYFPYLWGLHNTGQEGGTEDADIDAPEAWDFTTGNSDVVVAVIDTGVDYNHEDLAENMWLNPREIPNGVDDDGNGYVDDLFGINAITGSGNPYDDHSHGTHVAGTIGAQGGNGIGVVGVNWDTSIMALKFLDASGYGYDSGAIDCIEYAILMKLEYGVNIRLINASWGGEDFSPGLKDSIREAQEAGILFVAAAGNWSLNTDTYPHYPSSYDLTSIVSVAATNRSDDLASFSNYGPVSVDFGAPGVEILSTTPGDTYAYYSGTSMAAPHVSGAAALIWGRYTSSDPEGMRTLLCDTVDEIPALQGRILCGGRLNLHNALQSCENGEIALVISPFDGFAVPIDRETVTTVSLSQCASSITAASVVVTPDNGDESFSAHDDGVAPDIQANDGTYSAYWTPGNAGSLTLVVDAAFNGGSVAESVTGEVIDVMRHVADPNLRPFEWIDATVGENAGINGDDTFVCIPIGFDFVFYGENKEEVCISSNGFLTFAEEGASEYGNAAIPSQEAPNDLIAPYWDDLYPYAGGAVYHLLEGDAPNRRLTIEWFSVPYYGTTGSATFEVTLLESTDWMVFQYLDVESGSPYHDLGRSATVGIENATGEFGVEYSYNEPAISNFMTIWVRRPECDDDRDNDEDGVIDYPDDLQCWGEVDRSEQRCGLLGIEILILAPIAWAVRLRGRLRTRKMA